MPSTLNPSLPDYRGGSIVNLAASLIAARGGSNSIYPTLGLLPPQDLERARHLILMVVDGLGHDTLLRLGRGGALHGHLWGGITSVFPSTTASAIPAFLTGLAPQQHALTGWHMHFREIGAVAAVLPFTARHGGPSLKTAGVDPARLLAPSPIFDRMRTSSHVVSPNKIIHSDFNSAFTGNATKHGYASLDECFARVAAIVKDTEQRSFIHVYWPTLDAIAHEHGINSGQTGRCFERLDEAFGRFLAAIAGSDSAVVVTADHGFIDRSPDRLLELDDYPELARMLVLPLCGEQRVVYAYVRPECCQDFEALVTTRLGAAAALFRSQELVDAGWFGLGRPDPRLLDRIGHYTLVMRGNWTLADLLPGEKRHAMIGVHGGVSAAEMTVPLIVARA